ncbi:unnamed protein product [Heligmosomoides polygyrus]|uniref:Uncharacterized protein n=1 Tax=Heligmosomoides polygyrus TaxID=6339 RepID=A0A183FNI8_HELPZ|nr:unnamed protein product [Heligmosomoides polygyrus]
MESSNFMVDRTNEARNREIVQQYLNILDDSVSFLSAAITLWRTSRESFAL